jgi:hypothetical protein
MPQDERGVHHWSNARQNVVQFFDETDWSFGAERDRDSIQAAGVLPVEIHVVCGFNAKGGVAALDRQRVNLCRSSW